MPRNAHPAARALPHKVAVSQGLTPYKEALAQAGFMVVNLDGNTTYDAAVVSGAYDNLMGQQERETTGPVISAEGLTPEEIVDHLKQVLP